MATYSSILAWEIPWTEEPGGLQYIALQRVGHDWSDFAPMYSSGKYIQYPLLNHNGREYETECVCVCVCITELVCCTAEIAWHCESSVLHYPATHLGLLPGRKISFIVLWFTALCLFFLEQLSLLHKTTTEITLQDALLYFTKTCWVIKKSYTSIKWILKIANCIKLVSVT